MTSPAHLQPYEFSRNVSPSGTLLAQIGGAHEQLLREMERLDCLTLGSLPATSELTNARWQISQASLRRRSLSMRIVDFLSIRLKSGQDRLNLFREADQAMMRRSAQHVGMWTIETIRRDWNGYCAASREVRMHMRAHLLLEKQTLYPQLEQLAARGK